MKWPTGLECPACKHEIIVNDFGDLALHLPDGTYTFDRYSRCPGSGADMSSTLEAMGFVGKDLWPRS